MDQENSTKLLYPTSHQPCLNHCALSNLPLLLLFLSAYLALCKTMKYITSIFRYCLRYLLPSTLSAYCNLCLFVKVVIDESAATKVCLEISRQLGIDEDAVDDDESVNGPSVEELAEMFNQLAVKQTVLACHPSEDMFYQATV